MEWNQRIKMGRVKISAKCLKYKVSFRAVGNEMNFGTQ